MRALARRLGVKPEVIRRCEKREYRIGPPTEVIVRYHRCTKGRVTFADLVEPEVLDHRNPLPPRNPQEET